MSSLFARRRCSAKDRNCTLDGAALHRLDRVQLVPHLLLAHIEGGVAAGLARRPGGDAAQPDRPRRRSARGLPRAHRAPPRAPGPRACPAGSRSRERTPWRPRGRPRERIRARRRVLRNQPGDPPCAGHCAGLPAGLGDHVELAGGGLFSPQAHMHQGRIAVRRGFGHRNAAQGLARRVGRVLRRPDRARRGRGAP